MKNLALVGNNVGSGLHGLRLPSLAAFTGNESRELQQLLACWQGTCPTCHRRLPPDTAYIQHRPNLTEHY